jgi:N-acetylglucosaminyldiphosphoundecaprenol N-acetyl-beta-D-mannosaminyltransferase
VNKCSKSRRGSSSEFLTMFGIRFHAGPASHVLATAEKAPTDGPRMIVTTNVDHIISLSEDPAFREAYASAAVCTLDGMPLYWLARLRRGARVDRVTGHDLLRAQMERPAAAPARLFVVSCSVDVAKGTVEQFVIRGWDRTQICTDIPPFGFENDDSYSTRLASRIQQHRTTVLIMGIGAPKSEVWVRRNGAFLGSPIVLCIGGALAVGAGCETRAPVPMQRLGLEWFWRFLLSPRRLFHRYFIRSWRFPLIVVRNPDLFLQ